MMDQVIGNKDFESFVKKVYLDNTNEIFSVEYEGKKYWVKKARKTSSNIFHTLCYKFMKFPFLIPVLNKSPEESILFETTKLKEFKSAGINVPSIVFTCERFFVLTDCGQTLYVYLNERDSTEETFYKYLDTYIESIANVHKLGFYHGGAQSRNATYFEEKVFLIDLEDSFDDSVDIEILQFRDFLLMLLSLAKIKNFDFSFRYVIEKYTKLSGNIAFVPKLKKLTKQLSLFEAILNISMIKENLSGDIKNVSKLLNELKKL